MDETLRERRLLARAGFGPRPGELEALRREGAEAWLARQLADPDPADPALGRRLARFPSLVAHSWAELVGFEMPERHRAVTPEMRRQLQERMPEIAREATGSRLVRAVHGSFGVREMMLDFWSNHFSVYAGKGIVGPLLPHYQTQVLRPNALGRFEDLLLAVAHSPAMLVYLDNRVSTAVRGGRRGRPVHGGINENYARELLELHTLGVDGGYTQKDVEEAARVFTGWSIRGRNQPPFVFSTVHHDRGRKRVLGETVRGEGVEEGENLLRRLARHPSTAHHISRQLVARFVSDAPPPKLVERAARRFLDSEGQIREVLATVLGSREFADPAHRKLKTPLRFALGAVRETGGSVDGRGGLIRHLARLGELPYRARTPDGFPEEARHWVDPGAMLERMNFAFSLSRGRVPGARLGAAFPETATPGRGERLGSAEKMALGLASPEFQWA